jgi:uncharacterized protein (TIGR02147 family)
MRHLAYMSAMSLSAPSISPPRLHTFLDARAYLGAVYEWRSGQSRQFSYSRWAQELGFKSRSFVRMVVVGHRRITENSIPIFVKGLKLNSRDAEYFAALVRLTQAESLASREYHAMEVTRLRAHARTSTPETRVVTDHYHFLSSHHGPKLQTLLSLRDLSKTPEVLAKLLDITEPKVMDLLETLERIDLARKSTNYPNQWEATSDNFEVKPLLGDLALQSFHRKSLEEAVRAMDQPRNTRRYHSVLVVLSEQDYERIALEVQETLDRLLSSCQSNLGENRRLYQLNASLIPVSQPISRTELKTQSRVSVGHERAQEPVRVQAETELEILSGVSV